MINYYLYYSYYIIVIYRNAAAGGWGHSLRDGQPQPRLGHLQQLGGRGLASAATHRQTR